MVGEIIPELKGKVHGIALRVPQPTARCGLHRRPGPGRHSRPVNQAFQTPPRAKLKGILEYCTEELVSIDFKGNPSSCIFDARSTMVVAATW